MSAKYLNQILPLLKDDMLIRIFNEDIGSEEAKIFEIGNDYISVYIQDEYQTYAELYVDDEEFNTIEIIG